MTLNQSLIAEFQMEAANTRKMLERVPVDQSDFKPHGKSMALGKIASHIAELPGWVAYTLNSDKLDLATREYKPLVATHVDQLLALHDEKTAEAIAAIEQAPIEEFTKMWTLSRGEHVVFTMPKISVIRAFAFNHIYHHRGQLSVYLRMLGVPVPGMYGPSADDMEAMAAAQAAQAEEMPA